MESCERIKKFISWTKKILMFILIMKWDYLKSIFLAFTHKFITLIWATIREEILKATNYNMVECSVMKNCTGWAQFVSELSSLSLSFIIIQLFFSLMCIAHIFSSLTLKNKKIYCNSRIFFNWMISIWFMKLQESTL